LFQDRANLKEIIIKLGIISIHIEEKMEGPQDIEGCIMNEKIYVVQTRPQLI
jgi:phosphoenolpyruvate synthase/pyruvate phosphate dikinase